MVAETWGSPFRFIEGGGRTLEGSLGMTEVKESETEVKYFR